MSEASAEFGISHSTIRKWDSEGKLFCARTPGGTRLVDRQSLLDCLGLSASDGGQEESKRIICYARTSTSKQKNDLERQIQKVRAFVREKYQTEPIIFSEIGSGLSDSRKLYLKLVGKIISGEVGKIVCYSSDRLSRFGNNLFKSLCDKMQVGLEFVEDEKAEGEKSYEQELVEDLMAIVHVYSCRHYSRRASETLSKNVSEDALARMVQLQADCLCVADIQAILKAEGFRCENGGQPYTPFLLRRAARELEEKERAQLAAGVASDVPKNLVEQFIDECCTREKGAHVYFVPLYKEFCRFVEAKKKKAVTVQTFAKKISKLGFEKRTRKGGYQCYYELKVTGNSEASRRSGRMNS
jgi:putative resolvase